MRYRAVLLLLDSKDLASGSCRLSAKSPSKMAQKLHLEVDSWEMMISEMLSKRDKKSKRKAKKKKKTSKKKGK